MKQKLSIFVVDDISAIAHTLSDILQHEGHHVVPYTDPLRAIQDARMYAPDVVISDVEMPLLDGVDLARQILARCPECKVLLMSGHAGAIRSLEVARAGGFDFPFFPKPIVTDALVRHLDGLRPS